MRKYRFLTAALCAALLLCGLSVTAYADSDEGAYTGGYEEPTATPEPEPTIQPGEGFSEDGSLVTRDLLYDAHTNKQFIAVQARNGSTFYFIIDYDKPVDEDGEQYHTYFLNVVDEADLLSVIEEDALPVCSCAEKCTAGAVNMDCAVCSANMAECAGVAATPEPEADPDPADEPEPEGGGGMLLLAAVVVLLAGGAGYYFKVYRPKRMAAADSADEYEGAEPEDNAEWEDGGGYDDSGDYDDAPPWDEDEADGGESGDEA